ncbi:ABC transporter ATP-binding protein [Limosilactobacillus sp.]|uniref:ABC transporter ATP-binding protein n=1 Tax=Limosilactobacillus sp. TaxID=2773925 RepID=UPI003F08B62F
MTILKQLRWFFRQQWRQYLGGVIALVLVAVCNVIPARIIGNVVDAISAHRVNHRWLVLQLGIMLGAAIIQYFLRFAWQKLLYGSSYVLERQLRSRLFHHFMAMDPSFYQRWRIGDLMAHATNDVEAVREVASYGILTLADSIITGGSMIIAMGVFVSWRLTIITLLPLPLLVILANRLGNRVHIAYGRAQKAFGQLNNKTQESITGIKVIQSLGEEAADLHDFHHYIQQALHTNLRAYFWDALFNPATTLIMGLAYLLAIGFGGWFVGQGQLTVGQLVTMITYLGELVWPLFAIGTLFNTLERGRASYNRISTLLAEKPTWWPARLTVAQLGGTLKVDIERFSYPDGTGETLHDVHFQVPQGTKVGIVGPTGGGKSTLLRLLVRDFDHYDGQITVAGHDIRDFPLDSYRQQIGYTPQTDFLFSTTVEQNLRVGDEEASQQQVRTTAQAVAMDQEIAAMPKQFQTLVGQEGTNLSGGQRQRLSLGRALIGDEPLLVLDDPLSAVDAETAEQIEKRLVAASDQTVVMTTSRLTTVENFDWLIIMEAGTVTGQGRPSQLLKQPGWYHDTLREQLRHQQLEDDLNE